MVTLAKYKGFFAVSKTVNSAQQGPASALTCGTSAALMAVAAISNTTAQQIARILVMLTLSGAKGKHLMHLFVPAQKPKSFHFAALSVGMTGGKMPALND